MCTSTLFVVLCILAPLTQELSTTTDTPSTNSSTDFYTDTNSSTDNAAGIFLDFLNQNYDNSTDFLAAFVNPNVSTTTAADTLTDNTTVNTVWNSTMISSALISSTLAATTVTPIPTLSTLNTSTDLPVNTSIFNTGSTLNTSTGSDLIFSQIVLQNVTKLLQKYGLRLEDQDPEIIQFIINNPVDAELYLDSQYGPSGYLKRTTTQASRSLADIIMAWFQGATADDPSVTTTFACNFDNSINPMCGITQDGCDDGNWKLQSGPGPNYPNAGPARDNTGQGTRSYLYIDTSYLTEGQYIDLLLPELSPNSSCLTFDLHLTGLEDSQFLIFSYINDTNAELLWGQHKPISVAGKDRWSSRSLPLPGNVSQLVFRATRGVSMGDSQYCDFGLDNIQVTDTIGSGCSESPSNVISAEYVVRRTTTTTSTTTATTTQNIVTTTIRMGPLLMQMATDQADEAGAMSNLPPDQLVSLAVHINPLLGNVMLGVWFLIGAQCITSS